MSKKSLILCLAALVLMVVGIGLAVMFLYSGSGSSRPAASKVADESRYLLLPAVPSDAAAVFCFSDAEDVLPGLFSSELLAAAGDSRISVSFHHSGKGLVPLYVIDAGRASGELSKTALDVVDAAGCLGMHSDTLACNTVEGLRKSLSGRSLVIVSKLENLVKSSVRHLRSGESVMDAPGFAQVSASVTSDDVLFLSGSHAKRLVSALMSAQHTYVSSFFSRFAEWTAFGLEDDLRFVGTAVAEEGESDFLTVLDASQPELSAVSSVLPSYVISVSALPMKDVEAYRSSYEAFIDSKQQLASYKSRLKELSAAYGRSVDELVKIASPKEVATASFKVDGKLEKINLMRMDKSAVTVFCPEADTRSYSPAVHQYSYPGFASAVFGKYFSLADESCCTYMGTWLVSGSRTAIEEYVKEGTLEYTLADRMKDAGRSDLLASEPTVFATYFSFLEDKDFMRGLFSSSFFSYLSGLMEGNDFCPFVLRATKGKKGVTFNAELLRTSAKRSKAPVAQRDTTVYVPEGPFQVKNSGTGKMNDFYQNSHMSICLREGGKDLWGIPFQHKICGIAETIDYYANGKLQILFGAGDKIYLIDRLGRFVSGFPVTLGKDILLGPAPYDFNGVNKYNVMVLHKDNSLEMYNLKGVKPESWKGIRIEETIKSLPEKIEVGGRSYWVVRTSVQTLIFPLMGGDALTTFEGDKMIRPDSEIRIIDAATVGFDCYDGKQRSLKF